jgi:hypothetical protein
MVNDKDKENLEQNKDEINVYSSNYKKIEKVVKIKTKNKRKIIEKKLNQKKALLKAK